MKHWHENSEKWIFQPYNKHGKRHGKRKTWDKDGRLIIVREYKNGVKVGEWKLEETRNSK